MADPADPSPDPAQHPESAEPDARFREELAQAEAEPEVARDRAADARPTPAEPLSGELAGDAEELGAEMRAALVRLLEPLGGPDATGRVVAKALEIEGVVARRMVRAARAESSGLEVLTRVPSVNNLRLAAEHFSDRIAKQHPAASAADDLLDAVTRYEQLGRAVGGGKARLTQRVRATIGREPQPDDVGRPDAG